MSLKCRLLRYLIRQLVHQRDAHVVVNILWDECKLIYHEDNIPTRYHLIKEILDNEQEHELRDVRKELLEIQAKWERNNAH